MGDDGCTEVRPDVAGQRRNKKEGRSRKEDPRDREAGGRDEGVALSPFDEGVPRGVEECCAKNGEGVQREVLFQLARA